MSDKFFSKLRFKRFFIFLARGLGALFVLVLIANFFIRAGTRPYIYKSAEDVPQAQTALILGAAVFRSGELSPVFENRVNAAIELYKIKKVSKILASGDNSTVWYNEVNPARAYLLNKGVPDQNIFLDHAGFDTYSTMYRAREIFQVSSIIVVTQSFHLPRAVFIARALGINAYGIPADDGSSPFKNYMREIFASEKAVLDLILQRKPKFLGEAIPITGDGRNY